MTQASDLREVFAQAVHDVQPPPSLVVESLRRGRQLRRRHQVRIAVAGLAAVALLGAGSTALADLVTASPTDSLSEPAAGSLTGQVSTVTYRVVAGSHSCVTVVSSAGTLRNAACWVDRLQLGSAQIVRLNQQVAIAIVETPKNASTVLFMYGARRSRVTTFQLHGFSQVRFGVFGFPGTGLPNFTMFDRHGQQIDVTGSKCTAATRCAQLQAQLPFDHSDDAAKIVAGSPVDAYFVPEAQTNELIKAKSSCLTRGTTGKWVDFGGTVVLAIDGSDLTTLRSVASCLREQPVVSRVSEPPTGM